MVHIGISIFEYVGDSIHLITNYMYMYQHIGGITLYYALSHFVTTDQCKLFEAAGGQDS